MQNNRRRILKSALAAAAATGAAGAASAAETGPMKKVHYPEGKKPAKPGLFSGAVSYGNMLFIAGKGAHFEGDIAAHTKHVLDEIEKELKNAGSSMDKVLKVNVYLNDIKDYDAMNKVYMGRFGDNPPVRTTVAPMGGVPGNSKVEIDCIAFI